MANSCPKHVDKGNKHIKKICATTWFYLQDYTRMRGEQNVKLCGCLYTPTFRSIYVNI